MQHTIGLIADTHGLLRSAALKALQGVELIIHAGDIGPPAVLHGLAQVAPVVAVRGNVDTAAWAAALPSAVYLVVGGVALYVLHDRNSLAVDPAACNVRVVVSGHSHQPGIEERSGVLWINPGSAGPRRFRLPVSLALLRMENGVPRAELITLTHDLGDNTIRGVDRS